MNMLTMKENLSRGKFNSLYHAHFITIKNRIDNSLVWLKKCGSTATL